MIDCIHNKIMSHKKLKRRIKLLSKLNDHVIRNLSQKRNEVDCVNVLVNDSEEMNGEIGMNVK